MYHCPICVDEAKIFGGGGSNCIGCGRFYWKAVEIFDNDETRIKLSGWVREQNRNGIFPTIDDEVIKGIAASPMPTVMQRANCILLEIDKNLSHITENFELNDENRIKLYKSSYSSCELKGTDKSEFDYLLEKILVTEGYIYTASYMIGMSSYLSILPKGHIRIEELRKQRIGQNAFVAMWFDKTMNDAYENGIQKGIEDAGYEAVRIDKKHHNNKIIDEIMVEIKSSAFVVADLTEHNKGVYFEAGYALGLGLPVIWTCKDTDLENLHFDIRQYNCVTWKENELGDFAENLKYRIINTVGKGPSYSDTAIKNTT